MRERIAKFWEGTILPLRREKETMVLIVTHHGIINRLKEYLRSQHYQIHHSATTGLKDPWGFKIPNCSISEVVLEANEAGELVRAGDISHLDK